MDFSVEESRDGLFSVKFPRVDFAQTGKFIKVVFDAEVMRNETKFDARVRDGSKPYEVPQPVLDGNASDEFSGNRTSVRTSVSINSILETSKKRIALTPNDDGVNDWVDLHFLLLEIVDPVPLLVRIHDLSGAVQCTLMRHPVDLGRHRVRWDGRDTAGSIVAPGIYLYTVEAEADAGTVRKSGLIHVVY